jgi:hypothetical protein
MLKRRRWGGVAFEAAWRRVTRWWRGRKFMNQLIPYRTVGSSPALVAAAGDRAQVRFIEFFTANIRNRNTRPAYAQAVSEFLAWCEDHRVPSITAVQPVHVAGYIEELTRARSAPTAKQRLSAIRHLFDWLVVGQVMPANPASSVRGPSHVVRQDAGAVPRGSTARARRDRRAQTRLAVRSAHGGLPRLRTPQPPEVQPRSPCGPIGPSALRPYPGEPIGPRYAIAGMGSKRIPQAYGTALAGQQAPPIDERARLRPPRPADHPQRLWVRGGESRPAHLQILPKSRQTIRHGGPRSSPEPIGRARMIRHHGSYVTSRSSSPMT